MFAHLSAFAPISVILGTMAMASETPTNDYLVQAVPPSTVNVDDAFWSPRLLTNRTVTTPHTLKQLQQTPRLDNFAIAARRKTGKFKGFVFEDSDAYKWIEGAAFILQRQRDPQLEQQVDQIVELIAAAQEPDGYLYTTRTAGGPDFSPHAGNQRWVAIQHSHELYCAGHLYEAAVAYFDATGKRALLDVAIKNAELVCSVFGPGKNVNPDGHQEVEIGLVKLYRATGQQKYLDLSRFFLETRGRTEGRQRWGEYHQDHLPVAEQTEAVGHAVRAGYMYMAMADVAALTGDRAYVAALEKLWQNVVSQKQYITGGAGARHSGEAFGLGYELPNRTAYCETCAAIANAFWNQRMFQLSGDAKYLDVLERAIYNGVISGVSLSGDEFFYVNPLESRGSHVRQPWLACACCPPNVIRFLEQIPGFAYARQDDSVFVNLFIAGDTRMQIAGTSLKIDQRTNYPWDGSVTIRVDPAQPRQFTLRVRIPGWARGQAWPADLYRFADQDDQPVVLKLNGQPLPVQLENGFAVMRRTWTSGDVVALVLPMPVRRVTAHEKVIDDVGRVALQRGPIVYCVEGVDMPDGNVLGLVLPDDAKLRTEHRADLLGGVTVVTADAFAVERDENDRPRRGAGVRLLAVPYCTWANRAVGQMAVWLARDLAAAALPLKPTIAARSKASVSFGHVPSALNDQEEPGSSADQRHPFFHLWPHKGTTEWLQYDFAEPATVRAVEVYWFDDTGVGECRPPKSWRLLARVAGEWVEVGHPSAYGIEKDKYNRTTFDPVQTDALRLELQLQDDFSAGVHEWKVE